MQKAIIIIVAIAFVAVMTYQEASATSPVKPSNSTSGVQPPISSRPGDVPQNETAHSRMSRAWRNSGQGGTGGSGGRPGQPGSPGRQ